MKCIDVKENLDALLDGEISISPQRAIENHLENCVYCRAEFNYLQKLGQTLKQNLTATAPASLNTKIFSEFEKFHAAKRSAKISETAPTERIGWFGIPRFAFAAAIILFTLATFSAFQIGRMSADNIIVETPRVPENQSLTVNQNAENSPAKNEISPAAKIVEVPVIREKIVEIPVYKEKIVTRIIYKNAPVKSENNAGENTFIPPVGAANNLILSSRLKDNRYSTQVNLAGFQMVSQLKPQIIKGENNEK